ncbi:OLC1v1013232C2 [Oldenlandia corymbosa var. corymbosa]|uniref:OLC1v1013232C2 n=1 Tax=Oldenlandia corymbosa var. corymbosa TaxID=529605 RepID=A0AAV1DYI1_OLDCO|nr:OLC1v1013232C2 [Oldenlandia corymbosa var. corymbosa]
MTLVVMDGIIEERVSNEVSQNGDFIAAKEKLGEKDPQNGDLPPQSLQNGVSGAGVDGAVETSIEQLYENVCEMQSSDRSPSRQSFGSDGEESRIDSELRHLVGGEMREVEIMEEDEEIRRQEHDDSPNNSFSGKESSPENLGNWQSGSNKNASLQVKKTSHSPMDSDVSAISSPKGTSFFGKASKEKNMKKGIKAGVSARKQINSPLTASKLQHDTGDSSELGSDNPDLGPYLLKQARDLISNGDNPQRALDLALRASKSFEKYANGKPSLDVVMSLHVIAAIYCKLGKYTDAIPVLEHSIEIPVVEDGQDHALAKFAGFMQLGDTYAMLGQHEESVMCYSSGLEIQRKVLGDSDPRVGETCRYVAEAHVQALQFDEAEKLCQIALDIHRESGSPASPEEIADRRLMGLIYESKGDHEGALEHLVLASMAMAASEQDVEVASIDCSIGDTYLSLNRYDEAISSYQKALAALKSTKGENHPAVAAVFVRLADLYNKTGKFKESRSYCENALRIFGKSTPGIAPEEIAGGLTDISAIYESMNELEQALKLLQKALKIYDNAPGQQSTIAGIEAQMGVLYYMLGNYLESYNSFKNVIMKLRSGGNKSAFFGIALNQMGLACVQRYQISEALELFEEARTILEKECGPYHPDTLGVYSNLAGTYDAVGRYPFYYF